MNVIIHPGFGKSGTTSLQANLFSKHPSITSIGRPFNTKTRELSEALTKIHYDKAYVETLIREAAKGDCIVLSSETLVSNAHMRETIARRLKHHFPDARVMLTIRNQISALESYYANHGRILKGVPAPFQGQHVTYENWIEFEFQTRETSYLGLIDYDRTVRLYEDVFGADRVKIFLNEEMARPDFGEMLSGFLMIDQAETERLLKEKPRNPRSSKRFVTYTKVRQKFLPNVTLSAVIPGGKHIVKAISSMKHSGEPAGTVIDNDWRERLFEFYKDGNEKLSARHNLPLEKYGYPSRL